MNSVVELRSRRMFEKQLLWWFICLFTFSFYSDLLKRLELIPDKNLKNHTGATSFWQLATFTKDISSTRFTDRMKPNLYG
jgi:hypothetical protein